VLRVRLLVSRMKAFGGGVGDRGLKCVSGRRFGSQNKTYRLLTP
jgi:hypothetical protein